MTKSLTEQWREGTLSMGYYYVSTPPSYGGEKIKYLDDDCCFGLDDDIIQKVLAPVPSYDEYKELVSKTEQLEKQLAIATKALKYYAECKHINLDLISVPDDCADFEVFEDGEHARQALKEIEVVK